MLNFRTTTTLVGILSQKNQIYFYIRRYLTSHAFSGELVDFCNWTVCLPYEEAFEAVWNHFNIEHSQEYIQMVSSGISPDTYYQLCKNATLEQIDPNFQFVDTVIAEGEAEQTLSNILTKLPIPLNDFRLPALQEIYVALLSTSREGRAPVLQMYEAYINQMYQTSCSLTQNDINNINAEIADILDNRLKYTEKEATTEIVEEAEATAEIVEEASVRTARAEITAGSSTVLDLETEMENQSSSSYSEIVSTSNQVAAAAGSGAGSGSGWLIYLLIFIAGGIIGIIFYIWPRGQDSQIKIKINNN